MTAEETASPWHWARQARQAALQMLYQWEVGRLSIPEVAQTFWRMGEIEADLSDQARARATTLVAGTIERMAPIDRLLEEVSTNWRLDRMPVVDRLILRLGIYELLYAQDAPAAVVIDEALELARRFSSDDALPFINGVLDTVKRRLESGAIAPDTNPS